MLKKYVKEISEIASRGDAREESYYSALKELLEEYAHSTAKKGIYITTLPKKTEAGNPDFRVWDGKQHIVGYIEAKQPTVQFLDQIEASEQLKRYLDTFPNLILTNFYEFRLYRYGKLADSVLIGRPVIALKVKTAPPVENEGKFNDLLEKFFSFSLPKVYNAKNLAIELAKRTRFLKEQVIIRELEEEGGKGKGSLLRFYEAFKKYLIAGLTNEQFADLYSQTITYGLFAARTRTEDGFNRKLAYDNIPQTIGILRDVFRFVSLGELSPQMEWSIDDISEVLAVTDVNKLLHQYFHEGKGKDPVVHFYETFLAEYDPQTRERRGVYYTPEAVVSYIVRSLHQILKEHFGRPDGFADTTVTVLDPAAGTLTFLAEAAKVAVEEFVGKYGEGGKEKLIKEHILKNFYAFELMMAPYAVGHLKMSFLLEELGYRLRDEDRFKLYLTNTLEMKELEQIEIPGLSSLSEESHLAGEVKRETPILVILGNPPYSIEAGTLTETARELVDRYRYVDGEKIKEKGALQFEKNLQDDYVKFIAFAQQKIEKTGYGIIGYITNHSFLDNKTLRGMRNSIANTFDNIYLLDLHGSTKKRETSPDGSKDENVFDIQQGVSILILVKKQGLDKKIYRSDLFGSRENKYKYLSTNSIDTTKWNEIVPHPKYYFFYELDYEKKSLYDKYINLRELFIINGTGIITAHDKFVIDFNKHDLYNKFLLFKNSYKNEEQLHELFSVRKKKGWSILKAWERFQDIENEEIKEHLNKIEYRPFDERYIIYEDTVLWTTSKKVMRHMIYENIGLLTCKQQNKVGFYHAFITDKISESSVVSNKSREINYLFPLYLYPKLNKDDLFSSSADVGERERNIDPSIFETLSSIYSEKQTPEDILYYIYAVLYSNIYRTKYAEFLKIDFPRIPFTKDKELFTRMGRLGERLANLHLLKSSELDQPIAKFQGQGDNRVEKLKYDEGDKRLYFNSEQYVDGIRKEVWEYQIGGYQVCHRWLNDRKKRILTLDDIKHYCRVVTALSKTIEVQKAIDEIYPDVEKEILEIELGGDK